MPDYLIISCIVIFVLIANALYWVIKKNIQEDQKYYDEIDNWLSRGEQHGK